MTRIAEVLLALQQAGNVTYSGRVVMIDCEMGEFDPMQKPQYEELAAQHVAELSAHAKEMENALEEWEKEVKETRSHYYELNYYTTLQLLRLRKELGLIWHERHRPIETEVLALLHSISHEVTSENVHNVMIDLEKLKLDFQAAAKVVPEEICEDEPETQVLASELHLASSSGTEGFSAAVNSDTYPQSSVASLSTSSFTTHSKENIKPQLTEQDLNDAQKEILTNLVEYQGYPILLVLKALEECHESANVYDIQEWCGENEDMKFEEDEDEDELTTDSSDDSSSESASSDVEESTCFQQLPSGVLHFI